MDFLSLKVFLISCWIFFEGDLWCPLLSTIHPTVSRIQWRSPGNSLWLRLTGIGRSGGCLPQSLLRSVIWFPFSEDRTEDQGRCSVRSVVELDVAPWLLTWSVHCPDHCAHLHSPASISSPTRFYFKALCTTWNCINYWLACLLPVSPSTLQLLEDRHCFCCKCTSSSVLRTEYSI